MMISIIKIVNSTQQNKQKIRTARNEKAVPTYCNNGLLVGWETNVPFQHKINPFIDVSIYFLFCYLIQKFLTSPHIVCIYMHTIISTWDKYGDTVCDAHTVAALATTVYHITIGTTLADTTATSMDRYRHYSRSPSYSLITLPNTGWHTKKRRLATVSQKMWQIFREVNDTTEAW